MKLFAKSTAAELERETEKKAEDLQKSVNEVMSGLDDFIKASVSGKDETKGKEKEKDKAEADLAKSIQDLGKKETDDKVKKDKETADELAKSLAGKEAANAGDTTEMNAEEVIADFKRTIAGMVAKACVSIRESLIEHVDAKVAEIRDGQVIVAKALLTNGKLMTETMHEVAAIGDQGRPRKSVLSLLDKSMSGNGGGAENQEARLDPQKVMAKALQLNREQTITPSDVNVINHHVMGGMPIPPKFSHLFKAEEISVTQ